MKKNEALSEMTLVSQKIAKPHHNRLNGIANASDERSRSPRRGCPLHTRRSPELNSRSISDAGLFVMAHERFGFCAAPEMKPTVRAAKAPIRVQNRQSWGSS